MVKNIINLTNKDDIRSIYEVANSILKDSSDIDNINLLEEKYAGDDSSLLYNVAIKIAKSKILIKNINKKISITIVFAIYNEHNRIQDSNSHPNGENFIENKIEQLNWLFENASDLIDWKMIIVDDGCPNNSGLIAKNIIETKFKKYNIEVLFLENAIKENLEIANNLTSTNDSQKGGSIIYGMWKASKENSNSNHIIVYTDADLSIHLSQIGLLINDIVNSDVKVSIGSKREKKSVLLKSSSRNLRGMFFISLWKQLITDLKYLNDTQCPLKAFRADLIHEIIEDNEESKFAFDIELLLKSQMNQINKNVPIIKSQPMAMIDSEAESTTTQLNPYLTMLKAIAKMYKKYLPFNEKSEKLANFLNLLDENDWKKLVDNIPKENIGRKVDDFKYSFLV